MRDFSNLLSNTASLCASDSAAESWIQTAEKSVRRCLEVYVAQRHRNFIFFSGYSEL